MNPAPLRIGSRRSPMAMVQAGLVARALTARTGREVDLIGIESAGDRSRELLTQIGGTGVFVSSLRASLLAGEVDLAVHSLKDLPTGPADGIALAAVPVRDDPRDALVTRDGAKLADLPHRATVGTGSPRRAAQLLLLRPDIQPVPVRGNAGTRLAKVESGDLDAVILGYAGLSRIDRLDAVAQVFEPDEMLPAAGQGALAVECSEAREGLVALLGSIDDPVSRAAVTAERSLLGALEAGCAAPVGAYAGGMDVLRLHGVVIAADGGMAIRGSASGPLAAAEQLGRQVAADLLSRGA
ncbi:MAG: hydroxymethylbilane synthase, partial [Actinobacteria bacterium]|nr:hydroxymethylbilane synthase [Actinomycetota bacterium]